MNRCPECGIERQPSHGEACPGCAARASSSDPGSTERYSRPVSRMARPASGPSSIDDRPTVTAKRPAPPSSAAAAGRDTSGDVTLDIPMEDRDTRPAVGARASSGAVTRAAPDRVGKFVIESVLGKGGFGVVYRAFDPALQRSVAIKMVLDDRSDGEDAQRFVSEARVCAKLRHPAIVSILEAGTHEGRPYFVMDLVEGRDFGDVLKDAENRPPPGRIAAIVRDVARALDYAHGQGIVHRDVKPDNIIVDTDGNVRLTDFGLARHVRDATSLTGTGNVVGTPHYMAPEQALGTVKPQPSYDIWALGAILYEGLVGQPPFSGGSPMVVLQKVIGDELIPPRELVPTVAVDLETITVRCLEKDPTRRFQTAGEVAEELQRVADGVAIVSRPPGAGRRLTRWLKRHRGVAAGLVGVGVLALAGLIGWFVVAKRRADARAASERAARLLAEDKELEEKQHRFATERHELALTALEDRRYVDAWVEAAAALAHWKRPETIGPVRQRLLDARASSARIGPPFLLGAPVVALAFAPDGERLATAGGDGRVAIWNIAGPIPRVLRELGADAIALSWGGDGLVLLDAEGAAWRWRDDDAEPEPLPPIDERAFLAAFLPPRATAAYLAGRRPLREPTDHRALAVTGSGGVAACFDFESVGTPTGRRLAFEGGTALALDPSGRVLAASDGLSAVRVWDRSAEAAGFTIGSGKPVEDPVDLASLNESVSAIALGGGGQALVLTNEEADLEIWSWSVHESIRVPVPEMTSVAAVALSRSGRRVAVGAGDPSGTIRLVAVPPFPWRLAAGDLPLARVSRDGRLIAIPMPGRVEVRDVETGALLRVLQPPASASAMDQHITSVSWSDAGNTAVASDEAVRLIDPSGSVVGEARVEGGPIHDARFAGDELVVLLTDGVTTNIVFLDAGLGEIGRTTLKALESRLLPDGEGVLIAEEKLVDGSRQVATTVQDLRGGGSEEFRVRLSSESWGSMDPNGFGPSGEFLVEGDAQRVRRWDRTESKWSWETTLGAGDGALVVAVGPSGRVAVAGPRRVHLLSVDRGGTPIASLGVPFEGAPARVFLTEDRVLAIHRARGAFWARSWDLAGLDESPAALLEEVERATGRAVPRFED